MADREHAEQNPRGYDDDELWPCSDANDPDAPADPWAPVPATLDQIESEEAWQCAACHNWFVGNAADHAYRYQPLCESCARPRYAGLR